jgi:hypothetical protein
LNNPGYSPEAGSIDFPDATAGTSVGEAAAELDPSYTGRVWTAELAKNAYKQIKSRVSTALSNFTASGQNDPTNYPQFCQGDSVIFYSFCKLFNPDDINGNAMVRFQSFLIMRWNSVYDALPPSPTSLLQLSYPFYRFSTTPSEGFTFKTNVPGTLLGDRR